MKNNILCYARLFFLIFFLIISCSINSYAKEQYNYGKIWQSWNNSMRECYVLGFRDGLSATYSKAADLWLEQGEIYKKPEPKKVKKVRESVFLFFELSAIRDVINSLYNDPTNSFISFEEIIYIGRDKLKGENIEERLRKARKNAFDSHQLLQLIEKGDK